MEGIIRLANFVVMLQHDGFVLKKKFADRITKDYGVRIRVTDCSNISAITAEIDEWTLNVTNSSITAIASEANILLDSCLFLISVVHFEAEWAKKFKYDETFPKDFYVSKDNVRQVNMMPIWAFGLFRYTEDGHVQLLGIPYNDNETFLYLFLPRDRDGLENVIKEISGKRILALIRRCKIVDVEVEIPAFRIESGSDMKDALIKMGIQNAFESSADFSAISQSNLFLSTVLHKTFFEVHFLFSVFLQKELKRNL
ncbi:unnamed protein product [Toxocara canis]|uniref:SERPIN domain-containing protein n=1 Tax=Toxocara canis TaxID=6265 RepID=A0A183U473_TOXCA|nr:unnamed protein product [Toxocara canis]